MGTVLAAESSTVGGHGEAYWSFADTVRSMLHAQQVFHCEGFAAWHAARRFGAATVREAKSRCVGGHGDAFWSSADTVRSMLRAQQVFH